MASGDKTDPIWDTCVNCNYHGDYWIVKIDAFGNKLWDKDFGGTLEEDLLSSILQTPDGGYLLSGDSYSPMSGNKSENNLGAEQTWIIKTDSLGNKQWDNTMLTTGHDEAGFAIPTINGCYTIANSSRGGIGGYKTQPQWNNGWDYWIIKFCDTTQTTSIHTIDHSNFDIQIFPNPFTEEFTVSGLQFTVGDQLQIVDVLGRVVENKIILQQTENCKLETANISKGIYFLKVSFNGKQVVKKIVKE